VVATRLLAFFTLFRAHSPLLRQSCLLFTSSIYKYHLHVCSSNAVCLEQLDFMIMFIAYYIVHQWITRLILPRRCTEFNEGTSQAFTILTITDIQSEVNLRKVHFLDPSGILKSVADVIEHETVRQVKSCWKLNSWLNSYWNGAADLFLFAHWLITNSPLLMFRLPWYLLVCILLWISNGKIISTLHATTF